LPARKFAEGREKVALNPQLSTLGYEPATVLSGLCEPCNISEHDWLPSALKPKPRRKIPAGLVLKNRAVLAVVADGFDGAAFHGFFAARFFVGRGRLLVNERIAAVVVALEIIRGGFAAQVAVNALVVHVVFARNVFGVFICCVCHKNLIQSSAVNMPSDQFIGKFDLNPATARPIKKLLIAAQHFILSECNEELFAGPKSYPRSDPPLIRPR
jgi:hypothetical protein